MSKKAMGIVLTADQIGSRRDGDGVPAALAALSGLPGSSERALPFARNAGDEIQALFVSGQEVVTAVRALVRIGSWRLGLGVGQVDLPLPDDVRAASGSAFIAARTAVERARSQPQDLAVEYVDGVASDAQAALELLALQWRRRSDAGWAVADLVEQGHERKEIATRLDITASAVSQRARAAAVAEVTRGQILAGHCLERLLEDQAHHP